MRAWTILALFVVVGCQRVEESYTIGAAGPWKEGYGVMTRRGIELALDEINREGGIRGAPLRLDAKDDQADPARAAAIAQEFVSDPKILAVVGHVNSGAMLAASRVYDGQLAAVATSASSPDLTGVSPWVFRVISSDSLNGVILGRFATQIGGKDQLLRRAGVLYENDSYGRGLADAFRRNFHGTLVTFDPISPEMDDAETFVSYLKDRQAGIVFVAGREQSALRFLREARRQKFKAVFLGGDGWQGIVADPAAAEGAYVGTSFNSDDDRQEVRNFVAAFEKRFRTKPDAFAALSYDATRLIAKALIERGANRKKIRDFIASLGPDRPFPGVTGPAYFSVSGDPLGMGFRIAQVSHGVLTTGSPQ
jgi:branched-chain amino acid transport system substrate-binding protein